MPPPLLKAKSVATLADAAAAVARSRPESPQSPPQSPRFRSQTVEGVTRSFSAETVRERKSVALSPLHLGSPGSPSSLAETCAWRADLWRERRQHTVAHGLLAAALAEAEEGHALEAAEAAAAAAAAEAAAAAAAAVAAAAAALERAPPQPELVAAA